MSSKSRDPLSPRRTKRPFDIFKNNLRTNLADMELRQQNGVTEMRKANHVFGKVNFKTLFESIEADDIAKGGNSTGASDA
ncbi:MAG: hypothetical protein AAF231_04320 [Pseudomonadota bacterium]